MYSVNAVPLDNAAMGWKLRAPTKPLSELSRARMSVKVPGNDGVVKGLPGSLQPATLRFVVETPRAGLEALLAVFYAEGSKLTRTGDATREADMETLTHDYTGFGNADALIDVAFTVRLPAAVWRGTSEVTSGNTAITTATQDVTGYLAGTSAPIQDAIVRLRGGLGNLIVQDRVSTAWFLLTGANLATGEWLRFESATGRAFITTSDVWIGGTEVASRIESGGPRGRFELTPWVDPTNPANRDVRLRIFSTSRSGTPSVAVRGRTAHLV